MYVSLFLSVSYRVTKQGTFIFARLAFVNVDANRINITMTRGPDENQQLIIT